MFVLSHSRNLLIALPAAPRARRLLVLVIHVEGFVCGVKHGIYATVAIVAAVPVGPILRILGARDIVL